MTNAAGVDEGPVVRTESGLVRGIESTTGREWRGLPFAAPPTGERRWRPPALVEPWDGVRDATEFAPVCPQLAWDAQTETEYVDGDEDCLYLNVFAPAEPLTGLPVMVNLHGGGNWGFWPHRAAPALTSKGVIVVTPAYRLGTFGFVGHPALSEEGAGSSAEYGLLDQIAALEWAQDNIAAFGGDPTNVTLFGESAGSFDATALLLSPMADGLFARAALQTEAIAAFEGWRTLADAEQHGVGMARAMDCTDASTVLDCLRGKTAEELVRWVGPGDEVPLVGGAVLPRAPVELLAERTALLPLLLGSNREEAALWIVSPPGEPPLPDEEYTNITDDYGGESVRAMYPISEFDSPMWAAVAAVTDVDYTCPMRALALGSPGPVWRYLYTHQLEADPLTAGLRAAHFLDEPLLFGDPSLLDGFGVSYVFDEDDDQVSETMSTYWTNFAKTGNPNGPGMPEWPRYSAGDELVQVLAEPVETISRWRAEECDALRGSPTTG